jgi:uncharacterized protein with PQ loop repeat
MCDAGAIEWVESLFGDCIVTPLDKLSFAVGLASSLISLTASFPQVILNFRRKRVDGQSPFFFALLLTGSCLSFAGLLVTKGLVTQILQAGVYLLLDGFLLGQLITYKYILKTNDLPSTEGSDGGKKDGPPIPPIPVVVAGMIVPGAAADLSTPYHGTQLMGTLFGWGGAAIFISARIPQLTKNFKAKAVHNLSILYISMMIAGNLTYTLSVLLRSVEGTYLWKQAPFLIGVIGPTVCDFILLFQKWLYSGNNASSVGEEEEKEEGVNLPEL